MEILKDSIKIVLVLMIFTLPFYSVGLFLGTEFGEYYGVALALLIIISMTLLSQILIPLFFRAKRPLKSVQIQDIVNNLSFLNGLRKVSVLEIKDKFHCACFFKTWSGKNYIFINENSMKAMSRCELEVILKLHLGMLASSTRLRSLGGLFIYVMGIPLKKLSSVKGVALIAHFFFIPLYILSKLLFTPKYLKLKTIKEKFLSHEIVLINTALNKINKSARTEFDIFSEQLLEVFSLSKPKSKSLFNLLTQEKSESKNFFAFKMES